MFQKRDREKKNISLRKKIINFFLDLLFPIYCYGCQEPGLYLCDKCFKKLLFQEKKANNYNLERSNLRDIFICGDYDNKLLSTLIKAFKYESIKDIGQDLARFMNFFWEGKLKSFSLANKEIFLSEALIIPLPLSKKRKKERGFNQSEILAKSFSLEFCYPLYPALRRKNKRKHQAGLEEKARLKNVKNCFFVSKSEKKVIRNKSIILIDDVITTGATLNEAAGVLLDAGAREVYALVLAKG